MPSTNENVSRTAGTIDFRAYARAPKLRATHCLPLALALSNARPSDLRPSEEGALDGIVTAARHVQKVQSERERLGRRCVRPKLVALANAWTGCSELLAALGRFDSPRAREARDLRATLFANGLAFVTRDADAAWQESHRRLARLAADRGRDALAQLVADDVVAQIELATNELGDAIGVTATNDAARAPTALAEAVRAMTYALGRYTRILGVSVVDDDPATAERFRRAVAPLDDYRAARLARRSRARRSDAETDLTEPQEPGEEPTDATL